jgi:lipopolysaccharide export system permease protein
MNTIDKYIAKSVSYGILLILWTLVGLFVFFSFIEEVDDIGNQNYGVWQAIEFVIFSVPRLIYELFPTAVLLGSLLSLGTLANHSELTVIRAAGVSIFRIILSVAKIGIVLTLIAMFIGETVAPRSEELANSRRSLAQQEDGKGILFTRRQGFWARDEGVFINIRRILSDTSFGGISLYEFDFQQKLKTVTYAKTANYENGYWSLHNGEEIYLQAMPFFKEKFNKKQWHTNLNAELVKIVIMNPYKLSTIGLYRYVHYLQENNQRSIEYELALWTRAFYPLVSVVMIFLAIPFVFSHLRSVSIGQRILTGALLGIAFFMINKTTGHIGLVYEFNPVFSALLAPALFLLIAVILIRRVV